MIEITHEESWVDRKKVSERYVVTKYHVGGMEDVPTKHFISLISLEKKELLELKEKLSKLDV